MKKKFKRVPQGLTMTSPGMLKAWIEGEVLGREEGPGLVSGDLERVLQ
jgi:hypothetical protein